MRENDDTAWEKRGNEGQTGVEGGGSQIDEGQWSVCGV